MTKYFPVLFCLGSFVLACDVREGGDLSSIHYQLAQASADIQKGSVTINYELLYGGPPDWAIAVIPAKGFQAVGLPSSPVLIQLQDTAKGLKDNQYLVSTGIGSAPEVRVLSATEIVVDQQFVVTGSGLSTILARVVRTAPSQPPKLVAFELSK